MGHELSVHADRDRRREHEGTEEESRAPRPPGPPGERADERERRERHERLEVRVQNEPRQVERAQDERGHPPPVVAVVGEDGFVELPESADRGEVAEDGRPRREADARDHRDVGEGARPAPTLGRPEDVREGEERGGRHHELLVERGPGDQRPDGEEAREARVAARADQEREGPDQARVDERLGVRLVGLEPEVARGGGPEGRRPEADHRGAERGARRVRAEQARHAREHVEQEDRAAPVAGDELGDGVGEDEGRGLVIPDLRIERSAVQDLAGDHGGGADVRVEGFVPGVQAREREQRGQEREDEGGRLDPAHRFAYRSVTRGISRRTS